MYTFTYLALLAGVSSAVFLPEESLDIPNPEIESRQACPKLQIVALGGEGTTVGDLGYLQSTIDGITAAIPSAQLFQIGYPVGADNPTSIASGLQQLQDHVPSFVAQCPDSKIATVGYSAGAAAVMDFLCGDVHTGEGGLANDYRHHIVANVVYGDPTFVPGLKYDVGTCGTPGQVPRVNPHTCFPFGRKTRSYCTADDQVCCSGTDPAVHFTYPTTYDAEVAHFVKAKWTYYKNHN